MDIKIPLTNEKISKRFKSLFELVNHAIRLAENMIKTGRDSRVKIDSQNRALQVIGEIIQEKDVFDDIPVEAFESEEVRFERVEEVRPRHSKSADRKKARKILTG